MSYPATSSFVEARERCPQCAAQGKDTQGDNLAIYSDGHKWCFSCQYHVPSDAVRQLEALAEKAGRIADIPPKIRVSIPATATKTIDAKGLNWLAQYDISREEIIANDIRWCPLRESLIFPIRAGGELLGYQRRNFSDNIRAKWLTQGNFENHLHIINPVQHSDKPIVLVEDIISAIKVGRHARALCLFGSHVGSDVILRTKWLTKLLIFWLDGDKYKEAMEFAKMAELVGTPSRVLYTEKDPKEYDNEQIRNILYA